MPATDTLPLTLNEIRRLDDPRLLPWLTLYETAFPAEERMLVAEVLAAIAQEDAEDRGDHLFAAADAQGGFAGLVYTIFAPGDHGLAAELACLATPPERRNQGLGAWLYRAVRERVFGLGAAAMFLEVEIPERAVDDAGRKLAERRIAFYRRLGCRRLTGVSYLQYVGDHVAPVPMYVLVDAPSALPVTEVMALAGQVFDQWLTLAGSPGLE